MYGTAPEGEICELSRFFHDVHELQAGLREARSSLRELRVVVQGEQDRTAAIEAAALADHQRLAKAGEDLVNLRRQVEQALGMGNAARRDAAAVGDRLQEACGQLASHHAELAAVHSRLEEHDATANVSRQQLDVLGGGTTDAHSRLDRAFSDLTRQTDELSACHNTAACLEERLAAAEERALALSVAHDETVSRLQSVVESMIKPASDKAAEDRAVLTSVEERVLVLEAQSAESDSRAVQLTTAADLAAADLQDLQGRCSELMVATRFLQDEAAQAGVEAKADREQLSDACRWIGSLQDGAREMGVALRRAHDEVTEVRKDAEQQAGQIAALADLLAALRQGVAVTDGEICSLQDLLEGVPCGTA
mmetsp:Transcript_94536/g.305239  ORF Transcript_94536/g.305239 Transcript_94536/m.305239 type:complete len:366 (+) Transcript_94536:66-1163(+)